MLAFHQIFRLFVRSKFTQLQWVDHSLNPLAWLTITFVPYVAAQWDYFVRSATVICRALATASALLWIGTSVAMVSAVHA